MFEPYKDDLIAYSSKKNLEDIPFQRRPKGFFEKIIDVYILNFILMKKYEKNIIEKNKAIILATIIHKINLNSYKNHLLDKYYIGCLNFNPNGGDIDFLYYPFVQNIADEIKGLDCKEKDNYTYIEKLKELINNLKDKIEKYSKEEKEKYILMNYLIKIIIPKLKEKGDLESDEKTKKLLYELYDSINLLILNGLEPVRDSNILFGKIEFKDISIKIIKNISDEKEIFIFKNYIDKLKKILLDEIEISERAYSFDNDLNEKKFKKYLNERIQKSKIEKKELIKLFNEKTKESKININKYK